MKRLHILLVFGAFSALAIAVGYSDSPCDHKKDTIQVIGRGTDDAALAVHQIAISVAELSEALTVYAPFLGRPASNSNMVSEEFASVPVMRARPPPEKVQKSEYTMNSV